MQPQGLPIHFLHVSQTVQNAMHPYHACHLAVAVQKVPLEGVDSMESTALHCAAALGEPDLVTTLIQVSR